MDFGFVITAQEAKVFSDIPNIQNQDELARRKQEEETNRQLKIKEISELHVLFESIDTARINHKHSVPIERHLSLFQENFMKFLGYRFTTEELWVVVPCEDVPEKSMPVMHIVDIITWK